MWARVDGGVDETVDATSTATSHVDAEWALLAPPTTPPHNVCRGGRLRSSGTVQKGEVAGTGWDGMAVNFVLGVRRQMPLREWKSGREQVSEEDRERLEFVSRFGVAPRLV